MIFLYAEVSGSAYLSVCACSSFLNAIYFCPADSLTTVDLVWAAKLVPMGFHWGWWCWLCPGCQGKAGKGWGNSPTGVEMEVGVGGEGFCDHCSGPRGWSGVELGPSLNWPQMVGCGESVNSKVAACGKGKNVNVTMMNVTLRSNLSKPHFNRSTSKITLWVSLSVTSRNI